MNLFLLGLIQSFHWFNWILDSGFKYSVSRNFCHFFTIKDQKMWPA